HDHFPDIQIDFLVRKGNESLLLGHPYLHEVIIWDKRNQKLRNLFRTIRRVRNNKYDKVINVQRFAATGLLTAFSGAKEKIGFDKNPFSFLFTKKIKHEIGNGKHEIERNHELIKDLTDNIPSKPRLYPNEANFAAISELYPKTGDYICIA